MHDVVDGDAADEQCQREDEGILEYGRIRIEGALRVHEKNGNLDGQVWTTGRAQCAFVYLFTAGQGHEKGFTPHDHARGVPTSAATPIETFQRFVLFAYPFFMILNYTSSVMRVTCLGCITFALRYRRKKSNMKDLPLRKSPAMEMSAIYIGRQG